LNILELIIIFTGYTFVDHAKLTAALYVTDHLLLTIAIALKKHFQKIAGKKDIATTISVSCTLNHITT